MESPQLSELHRSGSSNARTVEPFVAAGAMLASSLSVVGNSMRLRTKEGTVAKKFIEILVPWLEPR